MDLQVLIEAETESASKSEYSITFHLIELPPQQGDFHNNYKAKDTNK
jgi:hypothetical protein